jgi:uncharacterized protein DUF6544
MILEITAIALLVAAGCGLTLARKSFRSKFLESAARFKAASGAQDDAPVTEDDLRGLPEPMARHLRFAGALGKKRISALHLVHSGQFKTGANKAWLPILGEYFITTKKPSFAWFGRVRVAPGVDVVAFDSYFDGSGRMIVKAVSLFPIVDDHSAQVCQSAFGRCVAELTMAPTFFLDHGRVRCSQTGPDQVSCTVTDDRFSTDAELFINPDGSLDRVVVMRHFDRGGGKTSLERFTGKSSRPQMFDGRLLASKFDGIWNLAEGDLHYVSFDVDRVEFE